MTKQHDAKSTQIKSKTMRLAIIGVLASVGCLVQGAALAKDALKPAYTLSDAALYQAKPLAPEAVSAAEQSVQLTAEVQEAPPKITLRWEVDPNAQTYNIYRKLPTSSSWGSAIQTIISPSAASAISYIDGSVSVGTAYEYQVVKSGNKSPDGTYSGHGYVYSGINVPVNDDRGHILILVDDFISPYIQVELNQLKLDLTGDGYQVLTADVPRKHVLEDWSKRDDVTTTKQIILNTYAAYSPTLKSIYFLGHIPVPYAGKTFYPDSDPRHSGAWPADTYYGETVNTGWTDSGSVLINQDLSGDYLPQENRVGDGKWTQTGLPRAMQFQMGRVDFYQMVSTSVEADMRNNEASAIRAYLTRVHNWRHKQSATFETRGLVDDNCGLPSSLSTAPDGENAWRNLAPLVGPANVANGDWLTTLASNNYLWAFGCGDGPNADPARWQGANGIGTTQDFINTNAAAAFNILCGKFFGDWNSQYGGDFLRAPLLTSHGLASIWACNPHWFVHHMGLGQPIGYSVQQVQNNAPDSSGTNIYAPTGSNARGVHIALMGDPTIRMHVVAPVTNIGAGQLGAGAVRVTWNASADATHGYHVYRATSQLGLYTRLTPSPIGVTTYDDSGLSAGTYFYMVRPVKLETSYSGSYFNLGQGVSASVVVDQSGNVFTPTPSPTPTNTPTPPSGGGGGTGTPSGNTPTPGGPTPTSPVNSGPTPTGTIFQTPDGTSSITPETVTRTPAPKVNCSKSFCVAMPVVTRR